MDDETRKAIEDILDDWDAEKFCNRYECSIVWISQQTGEQAIGRLYEMLQYGHGERDLAMLKQEERHRLENQTWEKHVYHGEDCPYTRLAKLVKRDGHQHFKR